jgi:hypothetical protein
MSANLGHVDIPIAGMYCRKRCLTLPPPTLYLNAPIIHGLSQSSGIVHEWFGDFTVR